MLIAQQDTAIACFHEHVASFGKSQADKIYLDVIMRGNATIGEIAKRLGMDKSAVSARQNQLRKEKRLMFGGERKCSVSGVTCKTLVRYEPIQSDMLA